MPYNPERHKIQYRYAIVLALRNSAKPLLAKEICCFILVHMPSICTLKNNNWENSVRSNLAICNWFEKIELAQEQFGRKLCVYQLQQGRQKEIEKRYPPTYGYPYNFLVNPEFHEKLYNGLMGFPTEREIEGAKIWFEQERQRWSAAGNKVETKMKRAYRKGVGIGKEEQMTDQTYTPRSIMKEISWQSDLPVLKKMGEFNVSYENFDENRINKQEEDLMTLQAVQGINNTWNNSTKERFYAEILIDQENLPMGTKYYEEIEIIEDPDIQHSGLAANYEEAQIFQSPQIETPAIGAVYGANAAGPLRTQIHSTPRAAPYRAQSRLQCHFLKMEAPESSFQHYQLKPLTQRNVIQNQADPFLFYEQKPLVRRHDQPPLGVLQQPAQPNFSPPPILPFSNAPSHPIPSFSNALHTLPFSSYASPPQISCENEFAEVDGRLFCIL